VVMQALTLNGRRTGRAGFSILIGSGGDASIPRPCPPLLARHVSVSSSDRVVMQGPRRQIVDRVIDRFSILIGSGGDASPERTSGWIV